MSEIDFSIPKGVQEQAKIGLDMVKEFGRGGTSVGRATARTLSSGGKISPSKARHIARYFPRHEVDLKTQDAKDYLSGKSDKPTNGIIAWKLWGGDAGKRWSEKLVRQMDREEEMSKSSYADKQREATQIQTLIFDKEFFGTADEAKRWARDHDFKAPKVDETGDSYRLRQKEPGRFREGTFRTITLTEGVKAVIARPKDKSEKDYMIEVMDSYHYKKAAFIGSMPNETDMVRKEAFTGPIGAFFRDNYLSPLGLTREDTLLANIFNEPLFDDAGAQVFSPDSSEIEKHLPGILKQIDAASPHCVVAVGKTAKEVLGDIADFYVPHPAAVRKHGDSGEISRKINHILRSFDTVDYKKYHSGVECLKEEASSDQGNRVDKKDTSEIKICKLDDEKQVVYGVVLDPYHVDTQNDWVSPRVIEETAHNWLANYREHNINHMDDAGPDTYPVESFVVEYPSHDDYMKARKGEAHRAFRRKYGDDVVHSGAWILGTRVSDSVWSDIKSGKLQGYSIEGLGVRRPTTKLEMPDVSFVDIGVIGDF
jgi:uracil-DNA glycosylase